MNPILLLVPAGLLAAGGLFALLRAHHILRTLDQMLDSAICGTFAPAQFSESRLSRTENKLLRFLSSSVLSRRAIDADRSRIQTLIGDIAHQTRTPIANLLLYTALLGEQPLPPEAQAMTAQTAAQAEKLQFLIDALVKTSRLETGMIQVRPQPDGSLAELLAALASSFQSAAQDKGITFTVCETTESACFDPKWTAEAVGNLIDNAIKYTPAGGRVTVQVHAYPMFCAIEVADTGPGLSEAETAQIFTRFYRAPAAHSAPGVGVGLYLARQILTAEGGYIRVRTAPGQGAVFQAFVPRS